METDPEPTSLLARVRWANVARALALVAVAALVVAWPRLRAKAPDVPTAQAVPVQTTAAARDPQPAEATTASDLDVEETTADGQGTTGERDRGDGATRTTKPRHTTRSRRGATRPAPRTHRRRRKHRTQRAGRSASPPAASLPASPSPVAAPPPQREFDLEGP
jgi:hypothetical protein